MENLQELSPDNRVARRGAPFALALVLSLLVWVAVVALVAALIV